MTKSDPALRTARGVAPGILTGLGPPLRQPAFRRIWIASLLSNLGQQVQAVAAGWTMLQLTRSPDWVACVQTASMLPVMVLAIPAGAIADIYDRRRVAMAALCLSLGGAMLLALLAVTGHLTPCALLTACFLVGAGIAIYSPVWQASAREVVGIEAMPAAVSLYSLSTNLGRSVGPAVGGVILAATGAATAFLINALLYLPLIGALYAWKRSSGHEVPLAETLVSAIISGLHYVRRAPVIGQLMGHAVLTAIGGSAVYALMPLVAHDQLGGGPRTYGLLLAAFGAGAVMAAIASETIRSRLATRTIVAASQLITGAALLLSALSSLVGLTALAYLGAGGAWMVSITSLNVAVQLSADRWVTGRVLACFQAATAGGLAGGSWLWGHIVAGHGLKIGMLAAAAAMFVLAPLTALRKHALADPGAVTR